MVLDLLDAVTIGRLFGVITLMVIAAAIGYSRGFRDGNREGYARGRAITRHAALSSITKKAVK